MPRTTLQLRRRDLTEWILREGAPWTRYRALRDLRCLPENDLDVTAARQEMLAEEWVGELIRHEQSWGQGALTRHNDAKHPLFAILTLADFGLTKEDAGIAEVWNAVSANVSEEGLFETLINVPKPFGGSGEDEWAWMACDATALVYPLVAFGYGDDVRVRRAVNILSGMAEENGWRCAASVRFGRFKGPGKREDPCPIANVHALKTLSAVPEFVDSPATRAGTEMLLSHWAKPRGTKYFMFGIGADFRKIKYPFIWYDILHVAEVLSRFPFIYEDLRFVDLIEELTMQSDDEGKFTAKSMYRAWKTWGFADKKTPNPWLTFLVLRILDRIT